MEFDDIFKVLKFWRVFKSLKNFRSGGFRIKFKAVGTVFALIISGASYLFYGEIGAEALELTPQDESVLQACLSNHKSMDMHFQGRISNAAGCGCTAKMVTASLEEEYFNTWAQAHALMLHNYQEAWSVTSEAQKKQFEKNKKLMFSALQKKSNMSPKLYSDMIQSLEEVDDICDTEETYSEQAIVKIASLRPIGYEAQFTNQALAQTPQGDVVEIRLRGASGPIKTASK